MNKIRSKEYIGRADATKICRDIREVQLKGQKMLQKDDRPKALNIAVISLS